MKLHLRAKPKSSSEFFRRLGLGGRGGVAEKTFIVGGGGWTRQSKLFPHSPEFGP